jgi:hypothetical protein
VNGEDRRRKVAFLLLVLAAVMAVASAAFAVQITLSSSNVDQLGGTSNVDVNCPADSCQINRVKWVLKSSHPFLVDKVKVEWRTASSTGSYTVCVTLFDNAVPSNAISGGCATQAASSSPVTTEVDVSDVDPALVYKVQIVIVQN